MPMSSREKILSSLRSAQQPFPKTPDPPDSYLPMVPLDGASQAELVERFVTEAEKLNCTIYRASDAADALETVMSLVENEASIMSWEPEQMGLPGLADALRAAGIERAAPDDPEVRIGLSGADAGLAATGSLLLASGGGKIRTASLLPPVHVAVLRESQILPGLESWVAEQRAAGLDTFRHSSNVIVISGPSRTADIAMELILGMHGPRELHIVLVKDD